MSFEEKATESDTSEATATETKVEQKAEAGDGGAKETEKQPSWQEEREAILAEAEERALKRLRAEQATAQPTDRAPAQTVQTTDPEVASIVAEDAALKAQIAKDGGFTNDTLSRHTALQQRIMAAIAARTQRELDDLKADRALEAVGQEEDWKRYAREHKGEGTPKILRLAWERERDVQALDRAEKAKKDADARKTFSERRIADTTTRDVTAREVTVRKMTQTEFDTRQRQLVAAGKDNEALQEQRDYRRGRIEVTKG